jgi:hypothetical protein
MVDLLMQLSPGDRWFLATFIVLVLVSLGGMAAVIAGDALRRWRCRLTHVTVNMQGDVICLHCRKNLGSCPVPGVKPPEHINCRCTQQPITPEEH